MKFIWKIILGLVLFGVMAFIGLSFWAYNEVAKIDDLIILGNETQIEKIKKADEWLNKLQKDNKFNGAVLLVKK